MTTTKGSPQSRGDEVAAGGGLLGQAGKLFGGFVDTDSACTIDIEEPKAQPILSKTSPSSSPLKTKNGRNHHQCSSRSGQ